MLIGKKLAQSQSNFAPAARGRRAKSGSLISGQK
jgi:hypothetical protein